SNGDFSEGASYMDGWAPSGPVYYSGIGRGYQIESYDDDYTSSPRSLSMWVWNRGDTVAFYEYDVAHANVDLTVVDTLTCNYKCLCSVNGGGLDSSGLTVWGDGSRVWMYPETWGVADETGWI